MSFDLEHLQLLCEHYYLKHRSNRIIFICKQCGNTIVDVNAGLSAYDYINETLILDAHWRNHGYVPPKIDVH